MWELVPPNSNQNIIGCKKGFCIKNNPDIMAKIYKAYLVTKGFD